VSSSECPHRAHSTRILTITGIRVSTQGNVRPAEVACKCGSALPGTRGSRDLWSEFMQSLPTSFLTRSASCPALINLAVLTSVLIDVTSPNTTACENQSVVVSDLKF
jgi:hypothetical protein